VFSKNDLKAKLGDDNMTTKKSYFLKALKSKFDEDSQTKSH
jgi:hypothetical protein